MAGLGLTNSYQDSHKIFLQRKVLGLTLFHINSLCLKNWDEGLIKYFFMILGLGTK